MPHHKRQSWPIDFDEEGDAAWYVPPLEMQFCDTPHGRPVTRPNFLETFVFIKVIEVIIIRLEECEIFVRRRRPSLKTRSTDQSGQRVGDVD